MLPISADVIIAFAASFITLALPFRCSPSAADARLRWLIAYAILIADITLLLVIESFRFILLLFSVSPYAPAFRLVSAYAADAFADIADDAFHVFIISSGFAFAFRLMIIRCFRRISSFRYFATMLSLYAIDAFCSLPRGFRHH